MYLVPNQTYVLTEVAAPKGYILSDTSQEFSTTGLSNGDVYDIGTRTNDPACCGVQVMKTDSKTGEPIAGAVFEIQGVEKSNTGRKSPIYDTDKITELESLQITSLDDGVAQTADGYNPLVVGQTYKIKEISAPEGYQIDYPNWYTFRAGKKNSLSIPKAPAAEPTLTMYYGISGNGTLYISPTQTAHASTAFTINTSAYDASSWPWNARRTSITKVVIEDAIAPASVANMFYNMTNLTEIADIQKLYTANATDMSYMFANCASLTSLNLSGFDTSNVTSMNHMFSGCTSLESLDVSSFDTSNVLNMSSMFRDCPSSLLNTLNLSSFDTSNVTDMSYMFYNDSGFTSDSVNTSLVVNGMTDAQDRHASQNIDEAPRIVQDDTDPAEDNVIALIDTGVSDKNPNVIGRYSVIGDEMRDESGHGQHMLDTMVAEDPDVRVISIKALNEEGHGEPADIRAAIDKAVEFNVKVINLSFSGSVNDANHIIEQSIKHALAEGIIVVASAGNDGIDAVSRIPANIDGVVTVGACDADGNKLKNSNFGDCVDVYAAAPNTSTAAARVSTWAVNHSSHVRLFDDIASEISKGVFYDCDATYSIHDTEQLLAAKDGFDINADPVQTSKTGYFTLIIKKGGTELETVKVNLTASSTSYAASQNVTCTLTHQSGTSGIVTVRNDYPSTWTTSDSNALYRFLTPTFTIKVPAGWHGDSNSFSHDRSTFFQGQTPVLNSTDKADNSEGTNSITSSGTHSGTGSSAPYLGQQKSTEYNGFLAIRMNLACAKMVSQQSGSATSQQWGNVTITVNLAGNTYAITFDRESGTGGTGSTTATYNSAMPTITPPTRTGYTFGGYSDGDNGTGTAYYNADGTSARKWDKTAAATLYAKWTAKTYAITLNRQSGNGGSASATATYAAAMPAITPPTRTGYNFGGYYDGTNGSGTQYYTNTGASAHNWDKDSTATLYAKWTAKTYAITLNQQSGNGGSASATATYAAAMPAITPPTRAGYTFGGYYDGTNGSGTQYYTNTGVSAHTWDKDSTATLYAKWTPNTYTVTLDWQSGTGGDASTTATYNSAMPAITPPTRTGYTFGGYYDGTNGSGTQYYTADGESVRNWNKASDTILYAKWIPNVYTITLDQQDATTTGTETIYEKYGTGVYSDPGCTSPVTSTVGVPILPKRDDYAFDGYYTQPDGRGQRMLNPAGKRTGNFTTTSFNADTTLYDNWVPLNSLDLSSFDTTEVTNMSYMFAGQASTKTIFVDTTTWQTSSVTNSANMFGKCYALVGGAGTRYASEHVNASYAHIDSQGNPGYLTATLTADGKIVEVGTLTNSLIVGGAKILKTDGRTGTALAGSKFKLIGKTVDAKIYDADGKEITSPVFMTSGADGYATTDMANDDFDRSTCAHANVTEPFTMHYCLGAKTMDCEHGGNNEDDSETAVVCRDCGKVKVTHVEVCNECCEADDTIWDEYIDKWVDVSTYSSYVEDPGTHQQVIETNSNSLAYHPLYTSIQLNHIIDAPVYLLPNQTYILSEVEAPEGYILSGSPREFTTTGLTSGAVYNIGTWENESSPCGAKLVKTDSQTGAPLQGAVFEFVPVDEDAYIYRDNVKSRESTQVTTDATGVASIDPTGNTPPLPAEQPFGEDENNSYGIVVASALDIPTPLANGTLTVSEGNGVASVSWSNEVLENTYDLGAVESISLGENTYSNIGNAQYSTVELPISGLNVLLAVQMKFVGNPQVRQGYLWITNDSNTIQAFTAAATQATGLTPGKNYKVKEISAPANYIIDDDGWREFTTGDSLSIVEIGTWTDTPFVGASFKKIDSETRDGIPDVSFTITASGAGAVLHDETGAPVNSITVTSNPDGIVQTHPHALLAGKKYTITETAAPAGYEMIETSRTFIPTGLTAGEIFVLNDWENKPLIPVSVNKNDSETNTPLAGAVFELEGISSGAHIYQNGQQVTTATITSGTDGVAMLPNTGGNGIIPGELYRIREVQAPAGYRIDDDSWHLLGELLGTQSIASNDPASTTPKLEGRAYAVLNSSGTLTLFRSTENYSASAGQTGITDIAGNVYSGRIYTGIEGVEFATTTSAPWYNERTSITSVVVANNQTIRPISCKGWFYQCTNLTNCNLQGLDTRQVTNFDSMFSACHSLTSLDVTGFDTSSATNFSWMFANRGLTSLNLSNFNTSKATDMRGMFSGAQALTSLDLSSFNTSHVHTFNNMFTNCTNLTTLNLSGFNTAETTNMTEMFKNASNLRTIYASDLWSTAAVTSSEDMFNGCTSLMGGKGTAYSSSHINASYARIDGGTSNPGYLTRTSAIANYAVYSADDGSLTFLYSEDIPTSASIGGKTVTAYWDGAGSWATQVTNPWASYREDIKKVEFRDITRPASTAYWFDGFNNENFITIDLTNLDTSNVTDMTAMFRYCSSLTSLDVSGFDTSNVTNMSDMFRGCSSLTSIDVSNFNTSNVIDMPDLFWNCSSLTSIDLRSFNTSNVVNMGHMFYDCSSLTSVNLRSFNTSNVLHFDNMFKNCSQLTSLDLSNFNTSSATGMNDMFTNCTSLTFLDLSSFDTSNVTSTSNMFNNCSSLKKIFVSNDWNDLGENGSNMFTGCTSLVGGKGTQYSGEHTDSSYARIDGGTSSPAYFTARSDVQRTSPAGTWSDTPVTCDFTLTVEKELRIRTGKQTSMEAVSIGAGAFKFELLDKDDEPVKDASNNPITASNAASESSTATVAFPSFHFTHADAGQTYTYHIKEIIPEGEESNGDYDTATRAISVTVLETVENGNTIMGVMSSLLPTIPPVSNTFTNYARPTFGLCATKASATDGSPLAQAEFSVFEITEGLGDGDQPAIPIVFSDATLFEDLFPKAVNGVNEERKANTDALEGYGLQHIATISTGSNGVANVSEETLNSGHAYAVVETKAPGGYTLGDAPYVYLVDDYAPDGSFSHAVYPTGAVNLNSAGSPAAQTGDKAMTGYKVMVGSSTATADQAIAFSNAESTVKAAGVKVTKVDTADNSKLLSGAGFSVYDNEAFNNSYNTWSDANPGEDIEKFLVEFTFMEDGPYYLEPVAELEDNHDGTYSTTNKSLVPGTYRIIEMLPPEGYELPSYDFSQTTTTSGNWIVEIADADDGTLKTTSTTSAQMVFADTETIEPPELVSFHPQATKSFMANGQLKEASAGAYDFKLIDSTYGTIYNASNDENGNISFPEIEYSSEREDEFGIGAHEYSIREVIPDNATAQLSETSSIRWEDASLDQKSDPELSWIYNGIKYDSKVYTLTVNVGYDESARFGANGVYTDPDGEEINVPEFVNSLDIYGGVRVKKIDRDTSQGLEGTIFKITPDPNSENVDPWTTYTVETEGEEGIGETAADLLPVGKYIVTEHVPPEGYALDFNYSREINITYSGEIADLTGTIDEDDICKDARAVYGTVRLCKVDNGNPAQGLAGATFKIIPEGGEPYFTDEEGTDSDGFVEMTLPLGSYRVIEESAPPGYEVNKMWFQNFEITEAGQVVDCDINGDDLSCPDAPVTGEARVNKTDADTGSALQGAVFELRKQGEANVLATGTTSPNGTLLFTSRLGSETPSGLATDVWWGVIDNTLFIGGNRDEFCTTQNAAGNVGWASHADHIKDVVFNNAVAPTTTANWFRGFTQLRRIDGLNIFDTSNVSNMSSMFEGCSALTDVDLHLLSSASLTNASNMFKDCSVLVSVDLSGFTIPSGRNCAVSGMFDGCEFLEQIDAYSWPGATGTAVFVNTPDLHGGNGTAAAENGSYNDNYCVLDGDGSAGFFTQPEYVRCLLLAGEGYEVRESAAPTFYEIDDEEWHGFTALENVEVDVGTWSDTRVILPVPLPFTGASGIITTIIAAASTTMFSGYVLRRVVYRKLRRRKRHARD